MPKRKKNFNISTSSLRSSSSTRRPRRQTNNVSSSNVETTTNTTIATNHNRDTLVSNSKKTFVCKGCKISFNNYQSSAIFINRHVKSNDSCPKYYPKCVCGKLFFDQSHLYSHQTKSKKSSFCHKYYLSNQSKNKFTSSQVSIPFINTEKYLPTTNIPNNLMPLFESQKTLMISKKHYDYTSFQSSMNFQKMNIHNAKCTPPKNFTGHAIMDPKSLKMKQHIANEGIYCNEINKNNNINNNVSGFINASNYQEKQKDNTTTHNYQSVEILNMPNATSFINDDNQSVSCNSGLSELSISSSSSSSSNITMTNQNCPSREKIGNFTSDILKKVINDDSDKEEYNEHIIQCESRRDTNSHDYESNLPSNINITEAETIPTQESIDIRDYNHFMYMKSLHNKEVSNTVCDKDYKDCLELVTILMKHKIPLNGVYQELIDWKNKDNQAYSKISLTQLLKLAETRVYGSSIGSKMSPTQSNVICPSGRHVTVTTFDIDALIFDLISDRQLMSHDNLIFEDGDENNPFRVIDGEEYGDIQTSEFYLQSMKVKEINQETDVLIPIQLYMDETVLDSYSKLSLHPLVMTLLIFNRNTRNMEMSWRTVAYIPNFDCLFGNKNYSVDQKHNDFHFVLRYLLNGIEKLLTSSPYYYWDFQFDKFRNKIYTKKIKFVLGNVLGDAKGANVLCSRYGNNTNTTHIARDCDVLTEHCDDPHYRCNFHKQKDLDNLDIEKLKAMSFRRAYPYNAFSKLDFGGNIYGINGACSADPCHMFNKGIVERLPKIFMARLTPKLVSTLDRHVGAIISNHGNQSGRNFPQIKVFNNGVSTSSKLRSDQHIARVFVIYLVLLTTTFESEVVNRKGRKDNEYDVRTRITFQEYNQWIQIFEETLILHTWVYLDKHPKSIFKGGKNSIACQRLRQFMDTYKMYAHRTEGMGLKFLKFHQIIHLWWIIRLFGSLYNVDTARCESHHRKKKTIARQTQRRIVVFDEQTSNGEYKHDLILKAIEKANIPLPKIFEKNTNSSKNFELDQIKGQSMSTNDGSKFTLTFDYFNKTVSARWLSIKMKNKTPKFPGHVLDALFKKFEGYNHGSIGHRIKSINGFTEYKLKYDDSDSGNTVIRACPDFRGDGDWYDWVIVNWSEYGLLEGQCLLFLDFGTITLETYDIKSYDDDFLKHPHDQFADSNAVLIHSIQQENEIIHTRECLRKSLPSMKNMDRKSQAIQYVGSKLTKFSEMEDCYQIISLEYIHDTAFVIPYQYTEEKYSYLVGCSKAVMVVSEMGTWNNHFIDYDNKQLIEEGSKREDSQINKNNERYPFEG